MNATISFDRQMGDLVWSLVTGLRAAYSLSQVIEAMAINAPEPTASALRRLDADLKAGLSLDEGLENLLEAVPSQYLEQVVAVILEQRRAGGNLADLLEPLVDGILQQVGSDGAFYPAMRKEAEQLGAPLPERARP
jgi:tight adherence protein B